MQLEQPPSSQYRMAENLLEHGVLCILLEVGRVKLHLRISHLPFQSS